VDNSFDGLFNYRRPLNGKRLLGAICREFAKEFNLAAREHLSRIYGSDRMSAFVPLTVTAAYPTSQQHCPRIAITQQNSSPRSLCVGNGGEIRQISKDGESSLNLISGVDITDTIELALCCLNAGMRDDLSQWLHQYLIDAVTWNMSALSSYGVQDLRCQNIRDDVVEYQGGQGQPGFEFYSALLTISTTYQLSVYSEVSTIAALYNWQQWGGDLLWGGAVGDIPEDVPPHPDPDPFNLMR
jgi:hypothetical protein